MRRHLPSPQRYTAQQRAAIFRRALAPAVLICLAMVADAQADTFKTWAAPAQPTLVLPTLVGPVSSLADHRGSVVIVHFFATWCEPCQAELRDLDRLLSELQGSPLTILAVDTGEPKLRTQRYFEANPVAFRVLLDIDKAAMTAWRVDTLPTTFVLGANLCPLWRTDGVVDWDAPATRSQLAAAVAELKASSASRSQLCRQLGESK